MVPRALLAKALRERDAAKDKVLEYCSALRTAVFEAVETLGPLPRAPRPRGVARKGTEEIAVLNIGDWQLGKVTPSYSSDVCERRVMLLAEKVASLVSVQRQAHPIKRCHVQILGDMVEGEGIFPTQAHVIDSGLYRQVGVNGPRILSGLLQSLLTSFETIHVTGVIGNHGQVRIATGTTDPETNMDRLLYQIVRLMFRNEPRISWDIPDGPGERNWFAVDRVFDWGFLLAHGDQIRGGFAGFPFYGAAKKAWGWIDSIDQPWDFLHFGHWHTPTMGTVNRRTYRCNGSTESDNTYAQEQLAAAGHPTQWLGFVHPEHGITAEYWVSLADREPNRLRGRKW
jgi:hypothetical protein